MSESTRLAAWRLGIIFGVLLIVEASVRAGWISSFFLAAPTRAAVVLWEQLLHGHALLLTGITLFEIAACLLIATSFRRARRLFPLALQTDRHELRDAARGAVLVAGDPRLPDLSRHLRPHQRGGDRAVVDFRFDPDHHEHQGRLSERQPDPFASRRQHESHAPVSCFAIS